MNKTEFLETLQRERAQWEALLAQVDPDRMTQPGVVGEWSVKDIIAHVSWGEREMVGVCRAHALVGSDLWRLTQFQRNDAVFQQNRDRDLDDVLAKARDVFQQLVEAVRGLDEEDLNDASRFKEMPPAWLPWQVIAGNCYEHYREHTPDFQAWLDKK
jgi:uncharacterized protein (TIGR03083 family)